MSTELTREQAVAVAARNIEAATQLLKESALLAEQHNFSVSLDAPELGLYNIAISWDESSDWNASDMDC